MTRIQHVIVPVLALVLGAVSIVAGQAQAPGGSRRGSGMEWSRGHLLSLLRYKQVQEELTLSDEDIAKVTEISEKLRKEMTEKAAALRKIDGQDVVELDDETLVFELEAPSAEPLLSVTFPVNEMIIDGKLEL